MFYSWDWPCLLIRYLLLMSLFSCVLYLVFIETSSNSLIFYSSMPNLSFISKAQFGCWSYIIYLTCSIYLLYVLNIANIIIITILLLFSPNSNMYVNFGSILIDFFPLYRSYFLFVCKHGNFSLNGWDCEFYFFLSYVFFCFYKYSQTLFRDTVNWLKIIWCFQVLLLNMCSAWPDSINLGLFLLTSLCK